MTKKSSVMTTSGSTAHGLTEREKDGSYMTQLQVQYIDHMGNNKR